MELHSKYDDANSDIEVPKKDTYLSEERQQIIDKLRLIPKKDVYFEKLLMN